MNKVRELIEKLNQYRYAYYIQNKSLISDKNYDNLFDQLVALEKQTGLYYPDSPTQSVGFVAQDELIKVEHSHPMLSLDKTKDYNDIITFAGHQEIVAMLKMDGLTCSIRYEDGKLVSAETRGNGIIGEDVTENIKQVGNIPQQIKKSGTYIIDGEVIIDLESFKRVNSQLLDEQQYSHPRNLASGSIRQLNTKITADRKLSFIAWKVIEGSNSDLMSERLIEADKLGFTTVPFYKLINPSARVLVEMTEILKNEAKTFNYPIDGLVFSFNDISYGESLGMTGHHPRHSVAFKFYDDAYETKLKNIIWQPSRTGQLNPVAIFEEVDLDGALTSRASLSNVSILKQLELGIGDTITVCRANQVIPHIEDNLTRSNAYHLPTVCPCCGKPVEIRKDGISEIMYCTNPECSAKKLDEFNHFVSKAAMDIDGLSEATLEKFINRGFIKTFADIYHLDNYKKEIIEMGGFGEKSYNKLIDSINNSRDCSLDKYIVAMGIPLIGSTNAKIISKYFEGDIWSFLNDKDFNYTRLDGFGQAMADSLHSWLNNKTDYSLEKELNISSEEPKAIVESFITGKIFVVTGSFERMSRTELEALIESNGGKLASSVNNKTDYLLTNDANSGSSKAKKAIQLNIPIMSEEEFFSKLEN